MKRATFALALLLTTVMPAWAGGDAATGEQKAVTCVACHGAGGAAPISPQYPILAGQYADYLAASLSQYKSGERKNMIMAGLAAALTEEDIEDLAAYFSAQSSPLRTID